MVTESRLSKIKAARNELERDRQRLDRLCRAARDAGATWTQLGYALGISAQAAQQRYGDSGERSAAYEERAKARAAKKAAKKAASTPVENTTP